MGIMPIPRWDQKHSLTDSIEILIGFAQSHAAESGRFSEILQDLLKRRAWQELCELELDYRYDDKPLDLYHARQTLGFFTKLEQLPLGVDKELVAWNKFQAAECDCRLTNEVFRGVASGSFLLESDVSGVLHTAQRKIARILGKLPLWSDLPFAFGPGANTSVKSVASTPRFKLGARLECSANLAGSVQYLLEEAPAWVENHAHAETSEAWYVDVQIVPGRLQFVPKNAKTYRSIVVEPILNSFAQKGVGSYLKRRLASAGLDTSYDQTRNRLLAKSGSITGLLATIDLSSASDTISKELVAHLLPLDWFSFLSQFRTGRVTYRGKTLELEKFSSMGNGFTFELETLLFYALAYGVCVQEGLPTGWTSSYGDDIIVPVEAVPLLKKVLRVCGFSINNEKSYDAGPFRESCGGDYWRGIDIRPFYQKDLVSGQSLFRLHNHYMREFDFPRAKMVLERIHPSNYLYGPDGYGDGVLIGSWHREISQKMRRLGWEGVRFDLFTLKPKRNYMRTVPGDWVVPVYNIYRACPDEDLSPYDKTVVRGHQGYQRTSIYTLRNDIFLKKDVI